MYSLSAAASRARGWLESGIPSEPPDPLKTLGLSLCARVRRPLAYGVNGYGSESLLLPSPSALVEMSRQEILVIAQGVTLSDRSNSAGQLDDQASWAHILGALALSHARQGDLVVVAALLRMAACLGLHGRSLEAALRHLLDQQQPDGSFGLLASELTLWNDPDGQPQIALRLTVEVLWALAEVATARARLRGGSSA